MTIDTAKQLVACCIQAPTADNHQPLKYRYQDGSLLCFYDEARVAGRTFSKTDPATLLAVGAAYENLLQAAKALSISVEPVSVLSNDGSFFSVKIIENSPYREADLSSHPIFLRHTNRNPFVKNSDIRAELDQLSFEGFDHPKPKVITQEEKIRDISKAIEKASRIRFETQEVHEWLGQSIRYGRTAQEKLDGLDINTLCLPPGGALFMKFISDWKRMDFLNKLGMSSMMAKIDAQPVAQASALIAITGENSEKGAMSAGGALTNVWGELNSRQLAVQPYYVLSDLEQRINTGGVPQKHIESARDICASTKKILGIREERLYMIFRVGRAKKDAVRSLRLPVDQVFHSKA